jgi:hypothetical protein
MKRLVQLTGIALALAVVFSASVGRADTTITGEKLGAFFRITVPDVWNGDLVIHNHGHDFGPPGPVSAGGLGPLASLMLAEGYAVAASSYSNCCWTLFSTQKDLNRLVGVFEANFGPPNNVILHGPSLGGIVTAQGIEKLGPNVVGAYPICGAVSGSRSWDGAIDVRLIYDEVCEGVPGGTFAGGATGLPAPGFPPGLSVPAIVGTVNTCTGAFLPPALRTPAQQARFNLFTSVTGIPDANFVIQDMVFVTNSLSNLIFAPDKLAGGQGVGNIGVTYNDATIDASIQRVAYDNQARHRLMKNYSPTGDVGATKIVSLHTDGDGLVIVENEEDYADKVPAGNLTVAIVDETTPSHCGFNAPELIAGWESLRAWIAGGSQPTAASIQAACLLSPGGSATTCRINPSYVIGEFDARIQPR